MTEKEKISPPVWVAWVFYLVLLTLFIPFFVMLASSFRSSEGLSFQWYRAVLSDQILWPAFLRSLAIAFLSSALASTEAPLKYEKYLKRMNLYPAKDLKETLFSKLLIQELREIV
jgi:ABC-type spermidine/putrescine transport system permease subunit II